MEKALSAPFSVGLELTVRNVNKECERNEKCYQISTHLDGGTDCLTASYARVAGPSLTEKLKEFMPISVFKNQ